MGNHAAQECPEKWKTLPIKQAKTPSARYNTLPHVVINITVIVDNQQGVYDQSAGNGSE